MTLIFSDQNEFPLILAVAEDGHIKKIEVISPRLPLPWGYASVDIHPAENGVQVRESDSRNILCDLPCSLGEVERLWTFLLPIIARAYAQGDSDARDSFAI